MKISRELKGMTGFADIGAAVEGIKNPAVRQANREIAEAQAKAAAKLAKANAKVAAKALKAETKEAIAAIKAGTTLEAVVESKGVWQTVGSILVWPFKASAKAGLWILEQPVALVLKPVKGLVNGIGGVFTKSPRTALAGTAILGAVAVGTAVSRHNASKLQAQGEAMQQMQAAQAMAAQEQAPVSYMNSASQADVDARIAADREQGVAGNAGSKAEAVMAARAHVPAPEATASAPPL